MEREATIKGKKDTSICDLYDKLEEMKAKLGFLTESVIGILEKTDYGEDFKDKMIRGFDLLMGSLENEFKNVETILDTLLDKQRLFESAEARIKIGIQKGVDEDINIVRKYIEYINKLKVRAEDVLKRGEGLLQRYQTT